MTKLRQLQEHYDDSPLRDTMKTPDPATKPGTVWAVEGVVALCIVVPEEKGGSVLPLLQS